MKLPSLPQWDRIHDLVDVLEPLSPPERNTQLRGMAEEDPLVLSCLRAHFLVPEPFTELKPGTVMAEKYTIVSRLGEGGMGVVYRAAQKHTRRDVAVKLIHPQLISAGLRTRFEQEISTLGRLRHPSLVQVFDADVYRDDDSGYVSLFYAMELVDGLRLNEWAAQRHPPLEEKLAVMAGVCDAVQAAHAEGIVHRDLKPQNILVAGDGRPVVLDFGLARLRGELLESFDAAETDAVSLLSGTLLYSAPELTQGGARHGMAAQPGDIYALGLIAFQLFTGRMPIDLPPGASHNDVLAAVATQTPHQLREFLPQADPMLNEAVMRALRRDPLARFATAAEFAAALRTQIGRRDRLLRRTRLAAVLGLLAAASLVAAGVAWHARDDAETRRAEATAAEAKTDALVGFMMRDLRNKLEQTGRLDLLEDVLAKAEQHYQERRAAHGDSPETRWLLANFLGVKAGVLDAHGQRKNALKLLEESVGLVSKPPHTAETRASLIGALQRLGQHHLHHGAFPLARDAFQKELDVALQSGNRHAVARGHRDRANALGYLKEWEPCRAGYLEARRILEELAAQNPDNANAVNDLAELEASLGSLEETIGNFPAMLEHFSAYHRSVLARFGTEHSAWSYSSFRMGVAYLKLNRPAEGVPLLKDAARLAEREVARRPGSRPQLAHFADCLDILSKSQESSGDPAAAALTRTRETAVRDAISAPPEGTRK